MDNLVLQGSQKIPQINFNASTGVLSISGRCIPEHSVEFFEPLEKWVKHYGDEAQPVTVVDVYLDYFNTSSSKCLLDLLRQIEALDLAKKTTMQVKWRYIEEDEDMQEAGEDYANMIDASFELIEMDED
ncbi:MAG: DUF1987 domain-containing protein [Flavobacteriales bacterium]|nr:DUF1987 domain-containing protein [Flavobacteriales bacterium]